MFATDISKRTKTATSNPLRQAMQINVCSVATKIKQNIPLPKFSYRGVRPTFGTTYVDLYQTSGSNLPETFSHTTSNAGWVNTQLVGNQSIGQYFSIHKDSFSHPPINRRLEAAVVGDWPKMMKFKAP
ncbi:hypothetical protein AVEN_14700-1 [Araneus ventricosus]|uniref:Uncharacterized protein n=1 Tax=Araneus ventricosus TaxID=182803 RepID=A0A4Y2WYG7_ARAVE|nr:hypothetical protein AVEN_14700-1 [Araneus ventricosus]